MRTYRSPLRLFVFGMIGVALILAAVDVMFGHWLSTPPESNNDVLTTRGQAQQRGDIVWGAAMVGIGTLLVGGSVVELVRRRPVAVVTQDGLTVAIGSHEGDVEIPWEAVATIGTEVIVDPYDGSERHHLVVAVVDREGLPDDPIGAVWDGDVLHIDAHDWSKPATEVALSAQGALGHHRRVREITEMGPPSVEWETTSEGASVPSASALGDAPSIEDVAPQASATAVDVDEGLQAEEADDPSEEAS